MKNLFALFSLLFVFSLSSYALENTFEDSDAISVEQKNNQTIQADALNSDFVFVLKKNHDVAIAVSGVKIVFNDNSTFDKQQIKMEVSTATIFGSSGGMPG